jgi:hypothetical protein
VLLKSEKVGLQTINLISNPKEGIYVCLFGGGGIRFCDSRNVNHTVTLYCEVLEHLLAGREFSDFVIL